MYYECSRRLNIYQKMIKTNKYGKTMNRIDAIKLLIILGVLMVVVSLGWIGLELWRILVLP